MHKRRAPAPLSALSALAAVTLLLAGCSGSDGDDEKSSTDAEQKSPLSEYLDAAYGGDLSPEEQEEKYAEQQRQAEELVAQCMQEQGFEYTPATDTGAYFATGEDAEWKPDDREWVAQYGYGVVNSPFSEEPPPEEEFVDPNADYVASLSESEQTAFYEALHGPQPTEEEMAEGGEIEYDWTEAGCMGAAQHEVAGEDPSQSEEFKPLFDAINELYADPTSWPGMAELDAEWATCMEDAGHGGHANPMEAQNSMYEEMNKLWEDLDMSADPSAAPVEPDQAAMDEIAEREVELALADLDCREATDYRDRSAEITAEVEQQFIDDHKAELDAMVAAVEQN